MPAFFQTLQAFNTPQPQPDVSYKIQELITDKIEQI